MTPFVDRDAEPEARTAVPRDGTDPVALTQALIRCQSVTPADDGALAVVTSTLERAGFACDRVTFSADGTQDIDNVYAVIGDTAGPTLCFAGHTDVVPPGPDSAWSHPPFAAMIADGMLVGRGAVDMKGAIAAFMAAGIDHVADNGGVPSHGAISLLITGDEEGPSINGTAKLLDWLAVRGHRLDACLVGEPTNPQALGDEIKIGRRGSLSCRIDVAGRQGHVAYPDAADNPVPKLAAIVDQLSRAHFDDGAPSFSATNLEVCVIGADSTATNVIPGAAHAALNVRYNTNWRRPTIEAHVRGLIETAAREVDAHATLAFSGTGDVFLTEPGPFVARVSDAVRAVTGRSPVLTTSGGTSDARFIQAHCPVVEFGLVNATIHAIDERVSVADLWQLKAIYRHILDHAAA